MSESGSVWLSDSLTMNCHMLFCDGKMGAYLDRKSWAYWDLRCGFSESLLSFYHCRSETQSHTWLYSMWPLVSARDDLGGKSESRKGARVFQQGHIDLGWSCRR